MNDLFKKLQQYMLPDRYLRYKDAIDTELRFLARFNTTMQHIINCQTEGIHAPNYCNSWVAYAVGICADIPVGRLAIKNVHLCDIDLDFTNREPIVDYLFSVYGVDNMAMVGSFQTMKTKAALREMVRWLENGGVLPNGHEIHALCKSIEDAPQYFPSEWKFLTGFTDDDGVYHRGHFENNRKLSDYLTAHPTMGGYDTKAVLEQLLQKPRYLSKHAGGVVITPNSIDQCIPTRYYNDRKCTQIDFKTVEKIGGMKIDILGVNTLNYIWGAIKSIQERHPDVKIDPWNLPNEQLVLDTLINGDTATVFQFDTDTARPFLKKIRPESLWDLMLVTSIARPGCLDSTLEDGNSVANHFVMRRQGKESLAILDPILEPILKDTYNVIIFQDQVQKIFEVVGGLSEIESDDARRAIGKKDLQVMISLKGRLFENATTKLGWSLEKCEQLWNSFIGSANYAWNKAHSVAYALVAYACAYLKKHYRLEWWCSVLTHTESDKIRQYLGALKRDEYKLPHVSVPTQQWTIVDEKLVAPLTLIMNIGPNAVNEIKRVRDESLFLSFKDFFTRVNKTRVNKTAIENLIVAGAFKGLPLENSGILLDDDPSQLLDYFYKLRDNKKDVLNVKYRGLDDRLHRIATRSELLPLESCNYVAEFADLLRRYKEYSFVKGQHHLSGMRVIENYDKLKDMAQNSDVILIGLVVDSQLKSYNDKRTGAKCERLLVTIENDCRTQKINLWPNQIEKGVTTLELKTGNLVAMQGRPKASKYYVGGVEFAYTSHIVL